MSSSFNIRPNLDQSRCVRTRSVQHWLATLLTTRSVCGNASNSRRETESFLALFETSLKGFRLQPFVHGKKAQSGVLSGFVKSRIKAADIVADIVDLARSKFSIGPSPSELESILCAHADKL